MNHYDAAIVGFGKGGKTLAGALAAAGKNVALIEQSAHMYGGTCINVACIPTKTLVNAAMLSQEKGGTFSERAQRYAAAIDEKDRVVGMLRDKNYHKLADLPNVEVIDGRASFLDATHLAIEPAEANAAEKGVSNASSAPSTDTAPRKIEADRIFINTGARPFVPPISGIDSSRVYVSETLLDLRDLPELFVVIGGGYIGLEFASMYANFGAHVTVVQDVEEFIPREDADIAASVLASLENRGIRVVRGARVVRIDHKIEQDTVVIEAAGEEERIPADAVLVATGRRPNTQGLNLEAAGVQLTDRGAVRTDEHLRTTAPNIHAVGDVVGGLQFTYISLDDFRIVQDDLLGNGKRTTENRGAVPYSVFLDPPLSRVGLTEREARDAGYNVKVAELPAAAIPKAQLLGKPVGLLKAIVDADTDKLLGVHLFCEESHEMINTAKLAIDAGMPYQALRDSTYTHPTMSEAFNDLFAAVK